MGLSSSTLVIFIALIPGLVFRYAVYANTLVKRPIAAGNIIHAVASILLISIILQISSILIFWLVLHWSSEIFKYNSSISFSEFNEVFYIFLNNQRYTPVNFLVNHYWISLSYLSFSFFITILFSYFFQLMARKTKYFGHILFGPLREIFQDTTEPIVACFIVTKICYNSKRLVYFGAISEISLRDGNHIDHLVLNESSKFYLKLNESTPKTTFYNSSTFGSSSGGLLYVSGSEIENVFFDPYYI